MPRPGTPGLQLRALIHCLDLLVTQGVPGKSPQRGTEEVTSPSSELPPRVLDDMSVVGPQQHLAPRKRPQTRSGSAWPASLLPAAKRGMAAERDLKVAPKHLFIPFKVNEQPGQRCFALSTQ